MYLLPQSTSKALPSKRVQRAKSKEQRQVVEVLMKSSDPQSSHIVPPEIENIPSTSSDTEVDILRRQLKDVIQENEKLHKLVEEKDKLNVMLQKKIQQVETLRQTGADDFEAKVKDIFANFLSSNQVDILLKKKSKARWTTEELAQAFTLRYFSKRCYIYLREKIHYPLPGLSTLQHWAANMSIRSGILEDVVRIMGIAGRSKTEIHKLTVLSFDEVKVSSVYEYDQKEDEIMGPHSYLQVIMARGLFDNWKQPVYLGFDKKMTSTLLQSIITKLSTVNYNVVACVSDCGGGNQGLWKELNIDSSTTYILHPVTKAKIYFFADAPHLLKLIRNWFLDRGFELEDGSIINKEPVAALVTCANTEISSCHKLSTKHLTCEKAERQNVALAAQLFSNTTATALRVYMPGSEKQLATNVSKFFQLTNHWFDVMNSYIPFPKVPSKNPYGKDLEIQNKTLNEMIDTMSTMRCISKKRKTETFLQVFQKGVIMSCRSLQSLYIDLKEKYNISYVLTHRLNQDCLENFFSQVGTYYFKLCLHFLILLFLAENSRRIA